MSYPAKVKIEVGSKEIVCNHVGGTTWLSFTSSSDFQSGVVSWDATKARFTAFTTPLGGGAATGYQQKTPDITDPEGDYDQFSPAGSGTAIVAEVP